MRIEQLTFTRFIAAISIVIFHYGLDVFPFDRFPLDFLVSQANVGVTYFFFLSGFVMIIAYNKDHRINYKDYFRNRIARIYPLYILAMLIVLLPAESLDIKTIMLNLLMVQSWVFSCSQTLNYPSWAISAEVFFFALFPILFNTAYREPLIQKRVWIGVILFWTLTQITASYMFHFSSWTNIQINNFYYLPIMHLSTFLAGNLFGLIFIKYFWNYRKNTDLVIIITLLSIIIMLKFHIPLITYLNGFMVLMYGPLIILLAMNNGWAKKILSNSLFVFLGNISYSVFIFQYPVKLICYKLFTLLPFAISIQVKFYIYIIALIVSSGLAYLYIEEPLRLKLKGVSRFAN